MATKTIVTKVDDIDGTPADQSFTFTWQGVRYDIDLSKAHALELKTDSGKWVSRARRHRFGGRQAGQPARAQLAGTTAADAVKPVAKPAAKPVVKADAEPAPKTADKAKPKIAAKPRRKSVAKPDGPTTAEVRAWAVAQGVEVADRGRLAPSVVERFLAAKATIAETENSIV